MEKMEANMKDSKSSPPLPLSSITTISKSTVYPHQPSTLGRLNLSAFDVFMLSFHYSQMGLLFRRPIFSSTDLLNLLQSSLSRVLSFHPPLAGRLSTDADGSFFTACNDAGVYFVHADAPGLSIADVGVHDSDFPDVTKELFHLNGALNLEGSSLPLATVQVTELADGVFVGCSINHAVVDGTSFWNFITAWSELCRGLEKISRPPDFNRDLILKDSPRPVPCQIHPVGSTPSPVIRDRVFHFSREAIYDLKARANSSAGVQGEIISTYQSLCAQLWRSVTRASGDGAHYFGNAIVAVTTVAKVEEVLGRELCWCGQLLHRNVEALGDEAVRREMETWKEEKDPRTLGNSNGPFLVVSWSPRFAMYENDMGWGLPLAVLSGPGSKVDGVVLAFPGREGGGSIDLEACLAPETMARLESDEEFMQYVAGVSSLVRDG